MGLGVGVGGGRFSSSCFEGQGSLRLWVLGGLMIWSLGRSAANLLGLKGGGG